MHRVLPRPHVSAAVLFSLLCWVGVHPAGATTDYNNDGLCDIWQQLYNAWNLSPDGDEDNDGCTNLTESIAGTDPRNPTDCPRIGDVQMAGSNVVLNMASQKGKRYQLVSSTRPDSTTWTERGAPVTGTGGNLQFVTPKGSGTTREFFKVRTCDQDSDNDGVPDWAEEVTGTNPALANSPSNASGGTASDGEVMASLFSLNLISLPGQDLAREKETSPGRMRLVRAADKSSMSLTVAYTTSNNPDITKGTASSNDYTLAAGVTGGMVTGTTTGTLTIPAGATSMDILVNPVTDSTVEVPELLTVHLVKPGMAGAGDSLTATATIVDAEAANEANRTLFVAYLGKEAGVNTTATGIATALVRGDNDSAEISLTFSNLTSPQNTAYLRVDSDLEIINIGNGQISGRAWQIRAAQTKFTDQAMLNALHAGQLYISITTADNPQGEIRGYFNRATGSTTFTYNPDQHDAPTPGTTTWSLPAGQALERDIWRFLDQCTYGGTEELYQEVLTAVNTAVAGGGTYLDGYSAWLDRQMNPAQTPNPSLMQLVLAADNEEFILRNNKPLLTGNDPNFGGVSYTVSYDTFGNPTISSSTDGTYNNNHPAHNNRRREMWTLAANARAQVRQRMAQALSEILVISEMDQTVQDRHYAAANYWDLLAQGAFGSYRQLLEQVTYSPMMGIYLSHIRNRAQYVSSGVTIHPDENYAREIMQLFSIGLVLRHPDGSLVLGQDGLPVPTYDNDDITELARVMTGFCHGARHSTATVSRFNGLQMTSSSQRLGPNIEIQGSNFTNFGELGGDRWFQAAWIYPMKVLGRVGSLVYHDFGTKTLLEGKHGQTVIPAQNLSGKTDAQTHVMAEDDLRLAHNILAGNPLSSSYNGHQNTPVNISRWLIQRLVTSNPSAGYLYRVSSVYRNTNGNLGAVMKAILLDYEARSLELADNGIAVGRMKEPLVHFMAVLRSLNARSGMTLTKLRDMSVPFSDTDAMTLPGYAKNLPAAEVAKYKEGASRLRFPDQTTALGQSPLRAPSVFNWFLPDYVVPGPMAEAGIFAPEMQIASETNLVNRINRLWTFTWSNLDVTMNAFPGVGVDDVNNSVSSRAGPQVKVNPTSTDTANAFLPLGTLTFTPSNWNVAQTVRVAAVDDSLVEGPHTTTISHRAISTDANYNNRQFQNVEVAITDNETNGDAKVILEESGGSTLVVEGGLNGSSTDTYTLRLSRQPTANVTIYPRAYITGTNNATQVTVSPASATFTSANWNIPVQFTVTAVDDSSNEGPHVGLIGHSLETQDPAYASTSAPSLQATVADNEQNSSNLVTITETQNSTIVLEGGYTDTYRVTLRRAPSGGNAVLQPAPNTQVSLNPSTLTFTTSNWNIPQTVTVTAVDDALVEGTVATTVSYTASGGTYSTISYVAMTVHDNDGGGITLVESAGSTTAVEGASLASSDSYTIRLNSAPTANVTVEVMPQRHVQPMTNHAKLMGYYGSDLPASNLQQDNVILDYTSIINTYNAAYAAAGGIAGTNTANINGHFAATLAVVDKFDLWWCGGQLKAQRPSLTLADLADPTVVHARKSIVAAVLNGYATNAGSSSAANIRDRCRIAAYLVSISPQSFNAR